MTRLFVTGATGNVGMEVLKALALCKHSLHITAGVRDINKPLVEIPGSPGIALKLFDFTDSTTYEPALHQCEILFLLRPPQLGDVTKYFKPLIEAAVKAGVQHIVFLSVQGVEASRMIPHHKIERLILETGIPYTFLRPAYFMQNFTTTLKADLVGRHKIILPGGSARFTLIDIRDIAAVTAVIVQHLREHAFRSYDITSEDLLNFYEMAETISSVTGQSVQYRSASLLSFYLLKRKQGEPFIYIMVMIMLHYFPRFKKDPVVTDCVFRITGAPAISFRRFAEDYKQLLASGAPSN